MRKSIVIAILLFLPFCLRAADSDRPVMSREECAKLSEYAPQPEYPKEARGHWWQGTGLFAVRVEISTGSVDSVRIAQSTGHKLLDTSAVETLKTWRFRPKELADRRDHVAPGNENPIAVFLVPVIFHMKSKT